MKTVRRLALAGLPLIVAACAGQAVAPPTVAPSPPAASATPVPSATATPGRAAGIVLSPQEAPPGTLFNDSAEGRSVLTEVVVSHRRPQFAALAGFLDGKTRRFSGEGGALLTSALIFDTEAHARQAYDLFLVELEAEDGYGLTGGRSAELGDESNCATGAVPTPLGEETICIWRNATVFLIAGGTLPLADLLDLAATMDGRV